MPTLQFSLRSLLIAVAAFPYWLVLIAELPKSPAVPLLLPPITLCIATLAMYRLIRSWRDTWAVSALIAGVALLLPIVLVAQSAGAGP